MTQHSGVRAGGWPGEDGATPPRVSSRALRTACAAGCSCKTVRHWLPVAGLCLPCPSLSPRAGLCMPYLSALPGIGAALPALLSP